MQDLPRIDEAVSDGSLGENPALKQLIEALKQTGGVCHLLGLVSPGGVHAHQDHAVALAKLLTEAGVPTLVHAITDGRDTPPRSSPAFIERLSNSAAACRRDRDRIGAVLRHGPRQALGADRESLSSDRRSRGAALFRRASGDRRRAWSDVSDEFIVPAVIGDYRGMQDGTACSASTSRRSHPADPHPLLDPAFAEFPRGRTLRFRRCGHDPIQRRAGQVLETLLLRSPCPTCSAKWSRTPGARSCGWRKLENTRTSRTS